MAPGAGDAGGGRGTEAGQAGEGLAQAQGWDPRGCLHLLSPQRSREGAWSGLWMEGAGPGGRWSGRGSGRGLGP